MKKRFLHISLIATIAILIVFIGINLIDTLKGVKIEDLVGNREELGNMKILAERNIGVFCEKRYSIGNENVKSKMTLEVDDHNGLNIYQNADVFKYRWASDENVYRDKENIVFVTNKGYNVEIRVKDIKSGEVKSKELNNKDLNVKNNTFYTMGVYYYDNKVKILIDTDNGIEIIEYDFNNDKFEVINTHGDIFNLNDVNSSNIIRREGEKVYILSHKLPSANEEEATTSVSNVTLFEVNIKENTMKTYNLDKFFKENNLDINGNYYSLAKVSNGIFYSDFIKTGLNGEKEGISFLGLDLDSGKIIEYKNILTEEELSKYGLSIWGRYNPKLYEDKLYFVAGNNFIENSFYVGCLNLNDGKLIYLGKVNGAEFNNFQPDNN